MEDDEIERITRRKMRDMIARRMEEQESAMARVDDLDDASFDGVVSSNRLVLVDFWAAWCGPCKMMHPVFERLAKRYRGIRFARVNVDRSRRVAQRFSVQSIPTFIMFRDGREAQRMVGAVGEPGIHMIANKFLGGA